MAYFPSFEIVTGNFARGKYFADDFRSVTDAGVAHVMKMFMRHFAGESTSRKVDTEAEEAEEHEKAVGEVLDLICEEEWLDEDSPQRNVS